MERRSWLNLDGKTVIVTGGASGIGRAVAQELLWDGANVAVCDCSTQEPDLNRADAAYMSQRM